MTFANGISWLLIVLAVVGLVRWAWHRSALLGAFILFGVFARVIGGLALYWISLRHLPILPTLQLGNGFWVLALDGMSYYNSARIAVEHGLSTISSTAASPAYVRLLAIALRVCGENPLTAVLVNVTAYVLSCAICIAMWPQRPTGNGRRARAAAIVALSFSPALLLASTQPLKDQVFAFLIVAAIACVKAGLTAMVDAAPGALRRGAIAMAGAAAVIFAISGIRAYYGLLIILAMALVLAATTVLLPLRRWAFHIVATVAATTVLWTAFVKGAGPYAVPYEQFVSAALRIPSAQSTIAATAAPLDTARDGFVATGGATNIVRSHTSTTGTSLGDRLSDEADGLMAFFVPISILQGLSLVHITGGRGLLAITDIDTVFLDLTIAIQFWLVLRQREWMRRDVAFLLFTILLSAAVMAPLAYVVTNYGTMFRMRVLYAIPLWLMGASLASTPNRDHRDARTSS